MTVIDRYIVRTFLGSYLILLGVGIGLYIISDLLLNIDEFTADTSLSLTQVLGLMVDFYGCNLPLYYSQLSGPLMAIAAAFTLGMMLRNNELTALVAAGVPLHRLAVPMLACSIGLILLWVVNREGIMPPLAPRIARTHDDIVGQRTHALPVARDENNVIVTALRLVPNEGRMERVFLVEPDQQGHPQNLIEADAAIWDPQARVWRLERGYRYVFVDPLQPDRQGLIMRREAVDTYPLRLTPQELLLRRSSEWADYLSMRQLNALLTARNLPNWPAISLARHVRLTQPMVQLVLLVLTIPFFLTREQANVIAAGGRALLLTGSFFALMFVSHHVVADPAYDALVAWLPILLFGPVAVVQLANVRT